VQKYQKQAQGIPHLLAFLFIYIYIYLLQFEIDLGDDILVGSTEEFQGLERLVMIISLARSSVSQETGPSNQLGFLENKKRFNVSLTR